MTQTSLGKLSQVSVGTSNRQSPPRAGVGLEPSYREYPDKIGTVGNI